MSELAPVNSDNAIYHLSIATDNNGTAATTFTTALGVAILRPFYAAQGLLNGGCIKENALLICSSLSCSIIECGLFLYTC